MNDVSRDTIILFPNTEGNVTNIQDYITEASDGKSPQEDDKTDTKTTSRLLANKIIKKNGDEPPLTTKAIRDLQRAQKERVFSKSLIRVRYVKNCLLFYYNCY